MRKIRPVLLVSVAAVLLYAPFFDAFAVPYPDFFSYHENAEAFLRGQLPLESKRLPLLPLLMAGLSRLVPGPEPILRAAELLNLSLVPVCLWLMYRIAAAFVGAGAGLAVAALCAAHQTMFYAAAQPLIEMTLLTLVLLVIHLALRGSAWAYAAAFFAALTRQDAALVIPLLVLQDALSGRRRWSAALALGAAAASGVAAWTAASLWSSTQPNPYLQELVVRPTDRVHFLHGSLRIAADVLPRAALRWTPARWAIWAVLLALTAAGLALLIRRHGARMVLTAGFFLGYSAVHLAFPAYLPRYTMPVLWAAYLAMAAALQAAGTRLPVLPARVSGVAAALAVGAMASCSVAASVRVMTGEYVATKRVTFRQVGAWFRQAAAPGDRLVTTLPRIVGYYSGRPEAMVYSGTLDSGASPEALMEELRTRGVAYLVWDSQYGHDDSYDAGRHRAHLLTVARERRPQELELVQRFHAGREEALVYRILPQRPSVRP